jgi:hypothetical protein
MNTSKKISATYNAATGTWSFSGAIDPDENNSVYLAAGSTRVSITLVTINNGGTPAAQFASSPFSWIVNGTTSSTPPACISGIAASPSGTWANFIDDNSAPGSYEFLLNANYNGGSIQSPDPTLINEGTTLEPVEA